MNHHHIRILFVCKERSDIYSSHPYEPYGYGYGPSYGLINSCKFIVNALRPHGITGKVVSVLDGNRIDKEVYEFKPTHIFIEALWVTPAKMAELLTRYPKINWFVRVHSKIPFLAHEGIAIQWLREYDKIFVKGKKVHISSNNFETIDAFERDFNIKIYYYPNIYCPPKYKNDELKPKPSNILDVGCFGAIRPMKNQLLQAMAAIAFGNRSGYHINFHINSNRIEQKADGVFKNLEYLFKDTKHTLVEHCWIDHEPFIKLVREMDLGMQVSMSESFNIVAADFVWNDIPVIGSPEIPWLSDLYRANINLIDDIISKLWFASDGRKHNVQRVNIENLKKYNKVSTKVWLNTL